MKELLKEITFAYRNNHFLFYWLLTIFIYIVLVFIDFLTGIVSNVVFNKEKLKSAKFGVSTGKVFVSLIFSVIGYVYLVITDYSIFTRIILFGAIGLSLIRELISIGENFNNMTGYSFYMLNLLKKMFTPLENLFFNKIKNKSDEV